MNNEGTFWKYFEREKYGNQNCCCPEMFQSLDNNSLIMFVTAVLWVGVSRFHCDSIFFSSSVMEIKTSVSLKNSARVIPKVWHIISSLSMGGIRFFWYHVEMVDCGIPDNLERRYVVHPRSSRKEVIFSKYIKQFCIFFTNSILR